MCCTLCNKQFRYNHVASVSVHDVSSGTRHETSYTIDCDLSLLNARIQTSFEAQHHQSLMSPFSRRPQLILHRNMLQSKNQSRQCSSPRPVQSAGNTYHGTISKAAQQSIILWFRVRYNQPPSRIIEIDTHTTRPLVLLSVQINKSVSSDVLDTTREPALDNIESNMAPRFAKYLSNLLDPTYCECCDHNLSPVVTEVQAQGESEPAKKSRWIWLGKFGWKKRVDVSRNPRTSDRRISKRRRFAKYLCLGWRREHNEQHRLEASGGAHAVSENQSKQPISFSARYQTYQPPQPPRNAPFGSSSTPSSPPSSAATRIYHPNHSQPPNASSCISSPTSTHPPPSSRTTSTSPHTWRT